jgi:hypothetical protein
MPESTTETAAGTAATEQGTTAKPKSATQRTIDTLFLNADLAVDGTRKNPEILAALTAAYNYTTTDLDALDALRTSTRALFLDTLQSRADQQGTTSTLDDAFTTATKACADFALLCREELKGNTAALAALGLTSGRAPRALAAFLTYGDTLFGNALKATGDVKAIFDKRGYTAARLKTEQGKLAALRAANTAQETAKAKAQNLTPQQRAALDTLTAEVNKLRKYARRALTAKPQLLEAIGVSQ